MENQRIRMLASLLKVRGELCSNYNSKEEKTNCEYCRSVYNPSTDNPIYELNGLCPYVSSLSKKTVDHLDLLIETVKNKLSYDEYMKKIEQLEAVHKSTNSDLEVML